MPVSDIAVGRLISGRICISRVLVDAFLLAFVFIYIGLWIALRPLGPDEIYFLHAAWSINAEGANPYSTYPFAAFPVILSHVVLLFGFLGAYFIKFVVLVFYSLIYIRITGNSRFISRVFVASCFVVLFYCRALDLRPELLSTLLCVVVILIWRERELRELKVLSLLVLELFLVIFISVVSPRFAVVSAFFAAVCIFDYRSNRKVLFLGLVAAFLLIVAFYAVAIGNPAHFFSNSFSFSDSRDPVAIQEKISILLGGRGLIAYLLSVSMCFFWVERFVSEKFGLISFLLVVAAYTGFVLLMDRLPYEYSSLPIIVFLIAYWCSGQSCPSKKNFNDSWRSIILMVSFLSVLALLYYVKDAKKGWVEVIGYSKVAYGDDYEMQAINNDRTSPYRQIEIAERICAKYSQYAVYVDHYRWSPMCLPDHYSAKVWTGSLSRDTVVSRISEAKHVSFTNEDGLGVWFYIRP